MMTQVRNHLKRCDKYDTLIRNCDKLIKGDRRRAIKINSGEKREIPQRKQ